MNGPFRKDGEKYPGTRTLEPGEITTSPSKAKGIISAPITASTPRGKLSARFWKPATGIFSHSEH